MLHNQTDAAKTTTTNTKESVTGGVTSSSSSTASGSGNGSGRVNSSNSSSNNTNTARQIKIGNYVLGATIGKGNSAVVKIATHVILKQKVAIKMFDKSALDIDKQHRLRREIDSMKRLKHQNIIQLYEIMETPKLICLVTEYASNGELYEYIIRKQRLTEREAKPIFRQIVTAVHFCHVNHIVHRDIKVENLLLDSGWQVKLADFGFSSLFKTGELLDVFCGSPPYSAPELYQAKLYDGPRVDIWSLGVVLYVLVCGFLPFDGQVINLLRSQVIAGQYKIPFFLSEDCKSLINGMLTVDTEKRFTMNDIINHKWLNSDHENTSTGSSSSFSRIATTPPVVTSSVDSSSSSSSAATTISTNTDRKEFRQLIDKIENISIQEFVPDSNVLNELVKFSLNPNEIARSVINHEFDSNAGIYYLLEARLNSTYPPSLPSTPVATASASSLNFKPFPYDINNNSIHQQNAYDHQQQHQQQTVFKPPITITEHLLMDDEFQQNQQQLQPPHQYQIKRNKSNTVSFSYEAAARHEKSTPQDVSWSSQQQSQPPLIQSEENEHDEEDDDDEEGMDMAIEELGKDYLSRYNSVRRHTIASNTNNDKLLSHNNEIMKSTECLLQKLNENLLGSCSQGGDGGGGRDSSNNLIGGEDEEAENNNNNENDEDEDDASDLVNSASKYKKSSHNHHSGRNSSHHHHHQHQLQLPSINVTSNSNGFLSPNYHNHFHNQQRKTTTTRFKHHHHHHYRNKFHEKPSPPQQQQQQSQQQQSTTGSSSSGGGRRASDGGSNISLFSQYYSLKNPYLNTNNPNNPNQTTLLPTTTTTKNEESSSVEESLERPIVGGAYKRGSITSGIPIFNLQINNSHHSSEEDDETSLPTTAAATTSNTVGANYFYGNGGNNMKYQQRRNSKSSRHEPYLDAFNISPNSSNSLVASNITNSATANSTTSPTGGTTNGGGQISPVGSFSRSITGRPREPSFSSSSSNNSGAGSTSIYANLIQQQPRSSEPPGQLELILANMSHLENIYNQSINNAASSATTTTTTTAPPSSKSQTQEIDQLSHLINNLPQIYCNVDSSSYMNSFPNTNTTPSISISTGTGSNGSGSITTSSNSNAATSTVNNNNNSSPSNQESQLASLLINAAAVAAAAAAAAAYQQQQQGTNGGNSTMSTDLSSSTLQMIQEEQTGDVMMMGVHSSESESPMSSVSTTPRMNRSSFCYMPTLTNNGQQQQQQQSFLRRSSLMNTTHPTTTTTSTTTPSHGMLQLNSISSAQPDLISKHLINMLSNSFVANQQQQHQQLGGVMPSNPDSSSSGDNGSSSS